MTLELRKDSWRRHKPSLDLKLMVTKLVASSWSEPTSYEYRLQQEMRWLMAAKGSGSERKVSIDEYQSIGFKIMVNNITYTADQSAPSKGWLVDYWEAADGGITQIIQMTVTIQDYVTGVEWNTCKAKVKVQGREKWKQKGAQGSVRKHE